VQFSRVTTLGLYKCLLGFMTVVKWTLLLPLLLLLLRRSCCCSTRCGAGSMAIRLHNLQLPLPLLLPLLLLHSAPAAAALP
jgi:hypothetical protein